MLLSNEDIIKANLLNFLWRFRNVEGLSGMTGIAYVLRNRVLSGWFGGNWMQVLKDASDKAGLTSIEFPDLRDQLFMRLLWKVESLMDGSGEDLSNGAKYWVVLASASDDFKKTILQNPVEHPRLANVGGLYFFG